MPKNQSRDRFILRITIGYAIFAALWIVASDRLLALLPSIQAVAWASTAKGLAFVLITAAILYRALQAVPAVDTPQPVRLIDALISPPLKSDWRPWMAYAFAVSISLATLLIRVKIGSIVDDRPLVIVFVLPLCLSAMLGGLGPGLIATAITVLGIDYLLLSPNGQLHMPHSADLFRLSFLTATGVIVSLMSEALHRARRNSETNRRLLHEIVSGTTDAIFVKDRLGRYVLCNEATERFIGKPARQIIGHTDGEIFPRQYAEKLTSTDQAIIEAGQTRTYEERGVLPDGREQTFLVTGGPVRDSAGRITGVFGISREISERKEIEQALRLRSSALEAAANAIVITDPDGMIEWVNPAFTKLTGYVASEAIGRSLGPLVGSANQAREFYENLWRTIQSHKVWTGELVNRKKDGTLYDEQESITPVHDEAGQIRHFVAIKQDISDRKRAKRPEEDRVGKEYRIGCRSRWSQYH